VEGAVEHEAARALGVPEDRILAVPDLATGVAAVRRGSADALALTTPTLRNVVKGDNTLAWEVYEPPAAVASLVGGCSALAFRLVDEDLAEAVDHGLAGYIGSPRHAGILEALGVAPDEAPPPSRVEGGEE
jgi:polar amino acid transport system substrate-binding protein